MTKHDSKTADLVSNSIQPIVKDKHGVERFKENKIVSFLLDNGGFDMNNLACMDFSENDREHFAQLIGYSLNGFGTLSYVSDETYYLAEKQRRQSDANSELVELRNKNAELEKSVSVLHKQIETMLYNQPIRDLEQKADALDNFKIPEMSYTVFHKVGDALNEQAEELREQAKQLKGGAK